MNCTLNDIADFNKFEVRQAAYYSNACYFLELIDENLKLTSLGEDIMQDPKRAKVRIYEQIIKNELIIPTKVAITNNSKYLVRIKI